MNFLLTKDYERIRATLAKRLTEIPPDERDSFIDEWAVRAMSKHNVDLSKASSWIWVYVQYGYEAKVRKELRRKSKFREIVTSRPPDTPTAGPEKAVEDRDQVNCLLSALDRDTADMIEAHYGYGVTINEISQKYGLSERTIKRRIADGLEIMRNNNEQR